MWVKILRALPYSADGIKVETLPAESVHDVRAELVPGLVAEDWVEAATAEDIAVATGVTVEPSPVDDFDAMTDEQLREAYKVKTQESAGNRSRATLIAALKG